MRKRIIGALLVLCVMLTLIPFQAAAATQTAKPSKTTFVMNGKTVSVPEAYDVGGNNYLQLRGIAVLLNGTAAQFNVSWDGTYAVIETGKPYTGTASPATPSETSNVRKSWTQFKIDGKVVSFDNAYFIGGDTNYLQLREVASKLSGTASQFNVYWDAPRNQAFIVPGAAYTGKAPVEKRLDGWYNLRCMYNYLNFDAQGNAELRKLSENEAFYVETVGKDKVTLITKDGKYLGITGDRKDGARVKAISELYVWSIHKDNNDPNVFSLRPPEATKLVVNASGQKNTDGTHVILWTALSEYGSLAHPEHSKFRFIPVGDNTDPSGESWLVYQEKGLYGYKDRSGNVKIKAQFDRAFEFSQGIASVYSDEKTAYAFIDTTGKLLTAYKYYDGDRTVRDGLLRVGVASHEVAEAIMNGDSVDYYYGDETSDVVVMNSGKTYKHAPKYGYIDTKGREVIPLQFDSANAFQDGFAAVYKFEGRQQGYEMYKVGWIDTTGKLAIPYKFFYPPTYIDTVHDFTDGLVRYFVNPNNDPEESSSAGIMDKTGKVIIPHNVDEKFPSSSFILDWKDGVIVAGPWTRVNAKCVPDKNGQYQWNFLSLYDYSGKFIKKLDGYVHAVFLGEGYTLALYQSFEDVINEVMYGYWSVFDRNGNIVIEKAEENNFYLLSSAYGIDNGYIYFGDTRYKLPTAKQTSGDAGDKPASTSTKQLEDGTYYIKASKNSQYVVDVSGASKQDGANLIIYTNKGSNNQKFIIKNVGDNKYTIQCVNSSKYWNSSGSKGAQLTQTGSVDDSAIFTITKQANGTYRIMDSKGYYVGISGANMADGTKVILWTEASDDSQAYTFERLG